MRFYQHVTRDVHRQTIEKMPDPPEPISKDKKVIPLSRRDQR
jgi:hypothetical protein